MIKDVLNKIITNIKDERVNRDSRTRIEPRVSSRCVAFDSKRVLPLQTEQSTGADTHSPWQKAILLETLFPGSSTCLLSLPLPLPFLYSPFSPFPSPPLPPPPHFSALHPASFLIALLLFSYFTRVSFLSLSLLPALLRSSPSSAFPHIISLQSTAYAQGCTPSIRAFTDFSLGFFCLQ